MPTKLFANDTFSDSSIFYDSYREKLLKIYLIETEIIILYVKKKKEKYTKYILKKGGEKWLVHFCVCYFKVRFVLKLNSFPARYPSL